MLAEIHPFETFGSVVGALVLGVMALTVFFKLVGWAQARAAGARKLNLHRVLDSRSRATVHLSSKETIEDVLILGFTDADAGKGLMPWELNGMLILESRDGTKTLVRSKFIQRIDIPPLAS